MKHIGITLGDINGIGAEVTLKAIARFENEKVCFSLIGSKQALMEQVEKMNLPLSPKVKILSVGENISWNPGQIHPEASRVAHQAIEQAVSDCLRGKLDAMVTAPICKQGFQMAGFQEPGHTELLARLTQTKRFGMMLIGGGLRVMLATRHLPISEVSSALSEELILEAIELASEGLKKLGIPHGRIGVCGLNPHAGDGGVLGTEELEKITPAIQKAQREHILVSGPIPADTIFYQALRGDFDAVVAMYHDQGLAPLKMVGFDEGVNITLGLPIIRTSPDHGTAFGIAGKNQASSTSMEHAIQYALQMSETPF